MDLELHRNDDRSLEKARKFSAIIIEELMKAPVANCAIIPALTLFLECNVSIDMEANKCPTFETIHVIMEMKQYEHDGYANTKIGDFFEDGNGRHPFALTRQLTDPPAAPSGS